MQPSYNSGDTEVVISDTVGILILAQTLGVNEGDELIINLFLYGSIFRDSFPSGGSGDLTTVTWVAKSKLDKSLFRRLEF